MFLVLPSFSIKPEMVRHARLGIDVAKTMLLVEYACRPDLSRGQATDV